MVTPVLIKKSVKRLEPDDEKLSSPVLRGRKKWQRFFCYQTLRTLIFFLIIALITLLILFAQVIRAEEDYKQDVISNIFSGFDQIKQQSCPENKKDGFYIFISLSMPKNLLEQYDQIAKQTGAKLVLRGFKNNSLKETIEVTQKLALQVDPMAFKKFGVTSVPSFVLVDDSTFDKLVGNVSIKYALEQFENQGDLKAQATEYLKRLK